MVTAEEAVWNALLEMEPQLAQMEEPDVPLLTAKFLDELQVRGCRSRSRKQHNC